MTNLDPVDMIQSARSTWHDQGNMIWVNYAQQSHGMAVVSIADLALSGMESKVATNKQPMTNPDQPDMIWVHDTQYQSYSSSCDSCLGLQWRVIKYSK